MADVIEAAKSGRAKCRGCGDALPKGELRFGDEVDNPFGDGTAHHWFHLSCAAERRPDKLLAVLDVADVEVPDVERLRAVAQAGVDNPNLVSVKRAERAPTGRARCQQCREKIDKGALRVALEREDDMGMAAVSYIHLRCAPDRIGSAGLLDKLRRVSTQLSDEDLTELEARLG